MIVERTENPMWLSNAYLVADPESRTGVLIDGNDELGPLLEKAEANGIEIVLCHTLDRVFAVRNLCSHAHEKLDCGKMRNGWIACPVHGARFDLETGAAMNPPAVMPIETFAVRVNGDTIEVAV